MIKLIWLNITDNNLKLCIKYLLQNINYQELSQTQLLLPSLSKSIIVIDCNPNIYDFNFENDFILVHLNDKNYMDDISVYEQYNCKLVIRSYYMPTNNKKIIFIPIPSFWNTYKIKKTDLQKRKYIWSFCGHIEKKINLQYPHQHPLLLNMFLNQRYHILNNMLKIKCNRYFYDSSNVKIENFKYKEILSNTVFLPCLPSNYNNDTKRLYDALEFGCIPILLRKTVFQNYNYFEKLFDNDMPFIYVDNYDNIEQVIRDLVKTNLEKKREILINKWIEYKQILIKNITNHIINL